MISALSWWAEFPVTLSVPEAYYLYRRATPTLEAVQARAGAGAEPVGVIAL
jgi:hypothetical protein